MGPKEVVGIAAFAVALAITVSLTLNLDGLADGTTSRPLSQGLQPPYITPVPSTFDQPPPLGWRVAFMVGGVEQDMARLDDLDLEFDAAPFRDYEDNNWNVSVEGYFELLAGHHSFNLTYDSRIRVFVGGELRAEANDIGWPQQRTVFFEHDGGEVIVHIEAFDDRGPFLLRFE